MKLALIRSAIALLVMTGLVVAQQPAGQPQETATIQSLLKEVHELRLAMERSNQIAPRIQIVLARIQLQEERVRNATRQLQDARDRINDLQIKKTELADRIKQAEAQQTQSADNTARKQLDYEINELKSTVERLASQEQQYRAKEADANSLLLGEQSRWNEANDALTSIERSLTITRQP
jgi:TolA-binding protein